MWSDFLADMAALRRDGFKLLDTTRGSDEGKGILERHLSGAITAPGSDNSEAVVGCLRGARLEFRILLQDEIAVNAVET